MNRNIAALTTIALICTLLFVGMRAAWRDGFYSGADGMLCIQMVAVDGASATKGDRCLKAKKRQEGAMFKLFSGPPSKDET